MAAGSASRRLGLDCASDYLSQALTDAEGDWGGRDLWISPHSPDALSPPAAAVRSIPEAPDLPRGC
jgi:hypothetical protein